MRPYLLVALFLAVPVFGQEQAPDLRAEAGCGPSNTRFEVKTDKNQHAMTPPESGKAVVYVIEDVSNPTAMTFGQVTTRVGLDGNWVGANHGQSYVSFAVEPGEHRVCADWQSSLKNLQKLSNAATLTAEAGKTYYYLSEVRIPWNGGADHNGDDQNGQVTLRAVDEPEGKLLISKSATSDWKARN
jgi:hypothetical protein